MASSFGGRSKKPIPPRTSLNELELFTTRIANILHVAGLRTIGDVVRHGEEYFLALENFSPQDLKILKAALAKAGHRLAKKK